MKRSAPMNRGKGFKPRQTTLRATPAEAKASAPLLKMRKCPVKKAGCGQAFRPFKKGQLACLDCAVPVGKWLAASKAKAAHKEDIKQTKAALEKLKRVPDLKKEAQEAFNAYVRFRDAGKGCFICGTTLVLGGVGGGFDAGHIRSRSNADNLRFDERNVHGQCKSCNAPGATKDWQMRAAAERLLGPEVAADLYADNKPVKWLRDNLREIRDRYRAELAALKRARR